MPLSRTSVLAAVTAAAILAVAAPIAAHMPYLLPSVFEATGRKAVTLTASFTEDAFRPEIAMRDAPFEITGPDGATSKLAAGTIVGDETLVEAPLAGDGLYRVSTGQRMGRMGRMYRDGNDWKVVGEGTVVPRGANVVDVRSTTLADAYVTRGRPGGMGALAPRGRALEIHPLADPTGYAAGAPARLAVLFDGRPVVGEIVTLFRERGFYDGRKQAEVVRSGEGGVFAVTPVDAGRYLLMVRYRPDVPAGTTMTSYTATLAFEAS